MLSCLPLSDVGDCLGFTVEGAETSKFAVAGCDTARGAVELWRIRDGEHLPNWLTDSAIQVLSWLLAHSRD